MVALFSAFLSACGGNDADTFIGEWVDTNPEPEKTNEIGYLAGVSSLIASNNNVTIESADSNSVFVTVIIYGDKHKSRYKVVKKSLVSERGSVHFEYADGKLNFLARDTILNKK